MMTRHLSGFFLLPLLALGILAVAGCGPKTTQVKGKVLKNGQPLTLSSKGMVVLCFYPENDKEGKTQFPAETKPDGTFTIIGSERKGIPPGKYRVAVSVLDPYPGTDTLGGKYSVQNSTLVAEVKGTDDLVIDVKTGK